MSIKDYNLLYKSGVIHKTLTFLPFHGNFNKISGKIYKNPRFSLLYFCKNTCIWMKINIKL